MIAEVNITFYWDWSGGGFPTLLLLKRQSRRRRRRERRCVLESENLLWCNRKWTKVNIWVFVFGCLCITLQISDFILCKKITSLTKLNFKLQTKGDFENEEERERVINQLLLTLTEKAETASHGLGTGTMVWNFVRMCWLPVMYVMNCMLVSCWSCLTILTLWYKCNEF